MSHLDLVLSKGIKTGDWSGIMLLGNTDDALFALNVAHDRFLEDPPEELEHIDPLTVYRATPSSIDQKIGTELSWTTSKDVAVWFYQRLLGDKHLYKATIFKDKIIAYTNCRNEFEVLQHRGVKNIEEVSVSQEDIDHAIAVHKIGGDFD